MKLNELHIPQQAIEDPYTKKDDHEVHMAKAALSRLVQDGQLLHDLIKDIPESEGLEGWMQAKITLAKDYLDSVRTSLEYSAQEKRNQCVGESVLKEDEHEIERSARQNVELYLGDTEPADIEEMREEIYTLAFDGALKAGATDLQAAQVAGYLADKMSGITEGENKQIKGGDPCWKGYQMVGHKTKNGKKVPNCVPEGFEGDEITLENVTEVFFETDLMFESESSLFTEAEYQGREVKLNKPMQGDVKKFKVYVKNPKGNVVKVNFGDPDMRIRKSNPEARKSFRARHNCDNPGPKHKARYWSCKKW